MKIKHTVTVALIALSVVILPAIQSCSKYPDGPLLSFRSREERVANTWKIDNYKVNGSDYTSLLSGYTETFTKDGGYSYNWGSAHGSGTWVFGNKDEKIVLTGTDNQSDYVLEILKLEEKQFWYSYMDGNDLKEFHMVEN